jgi:hypothetical protein
VRFVLAILAFAAAAVMVGFGIAQRTVFLEPDKVALGTVVDDRSEYIVLEPEALAAHEGKQTITVSGGDTVFLAYGRTADVLAWIGDDPYVSVGYDAETGELDPEPIVATDVGGEGTDSDDGDGTETETAEPADDQAEPVVRAPGRRRRRLPLAGARAVSPPHPAPPRTRAP